MSDVIVVSAITERRHMIDEYEDQLAAAGIDFHLETVNLADGIGSITARWKLAFMRRMCERFAHFSRIVFTDAWDVLFFGTKEELLAKLPDFPMLGAERNCWPEPGIASNFNSGSPWRFCNAGMLAGCPKQILQWIELALKTPDLDMMEQAWFNRRRANQDLMFRLDVYTSLFYNVSYDREDGALQLRGGRLWNSTFDTFPQFFHFPGPCSSVPFRAMLRTGKPLCASA
jgi:hypothetical protein